MRTRASLVAFVHVWCFLACGIAFGDDIGPPLRLPRGALKMQPTVLSAGEKSQILSYVPTGFQVQEALKVDLTNDGTDEIILFYDNFTTASSMAEMTSRCLILQVSGHGYRRHPVFDDTNKREASFGTGHAPPLLYTLNGTTMMRVKTYDRGRAAFAEVYWDGHRFVARRVRQGKG